jgi:predicted HicB family RNase H-like nuclease
MKQIKARVPDEVHAKLAAMAAADRRSLNSMLVTLIEEAARKRDSPAA